MNCFTKCYYCVCQVCNLRKCPLSRDRTQLCINSCISKGERIPRLDCDYFEHFRKTKVYRVKRHRKPNKTYSERSVVNILDTLLTPLGIDTESDTGSYILYYGDLVVGEYQSLSSAQQASKNYKIQSKVKIIRKRMQG